MKTVTKKKITFAEYDTAEYIETKEDVIALLEVTLEENDPDFLLSVVGDIARSKGMTRIAKELNMSRKGLYKALAPDGNPSFKTVFKLLDLLGLRIKVVQKSMNKRAEAKKRMKKVPA
jgi:probable addiction module antidote protein